jgi:hypothetical protein
LDKANYVNVFSLLSQKILFGSWNPVDRDFLRDIYGIIFKARHVRFCRFGAIAIFTSVKFNKTLKKKQKGIMSSYA